MRADTVPARGRGCSRVCTRMIDTSQTPPSALIGCVDSGALILLSDHSHNFSKYNK